MHAELTATPGAAPDLAAFLRGVHEDGRAGVWPGPTPAVDSAVHGILKELDRSGRSHLAGEGPDYRPVVAAWAAGLLYQACQFVVLRDLGEPAIVEAFKTPCPEPRSPATDWSADLCLRHLAAVYRLARHLNRADPLLRELLVLGSAWPLSSVGMSELASPDLQSFVVHPALRQLYADRILATGDASRLGHPEVDACLRSALGVHEQLSPDLAARLKAGSGSTPISIRTP